MTSDDGMAPACTLGATEGMTRRRRWLDLGAVALTGKVATPTGVRLRYRAGPEVERVIRELARLEAECCAFATWSVSIEESGVVLDVRADGGSRWQSQSRGVSWRCACSWRTAAEAPLPRRR